MSTLSLIMFSGAAAAATNWAVKVGSTNASEARTQALPAAPGGIAAACSAPASAKTITVSWSAVSHASAYLVYQATSTTSTPGTYGAASGGTYATTSWTSATLTNATNYWFKVVAEVGSNWVSASSSATAESTINSANPFCQQP